MEKKKFYEKVLTFAESGGAAAPNYFTYNDLLGYAKAAARQAGCNHQAIKITAEDRHGKTYIQFWYERMETDEEHQERERTNKSRFDVMRLRQLQQSAEALGFELAPITKRTCHAARDGECMWEACPQERDGEPAKTGRHCPYDTGEDDEL